MNFMLLIGLLLCSLAAGCKIDLYLDTREIHLTTSIIEHSLRDKNMLPMRFFKPSRCELNKVTENIWTPDHNVERTIRKAGLLRRESADGVVAPSILVFVQSAGYSASLFEYIHDPSVIRLMNYTNTYVVMVGLRTDMYDDFITKKEKCVVEQEKKYYLDGWVHATVCTTTSTKKNPNVYIIDKLLADRYKMKDVDAEDVLFELQMMENSDKYNASFKSAVFQALWEILTDIYDKQPNDDTIGDMCDNCSQ